MDSKLILVVIGVIVMAFGRSEAIKCYQCSSGIECQDPFNSNGVDTCQGTTCTKVYVGLSAGASIIRGCNYASAEKDECVGSSVAGITSKRCACKSDLCNDGQLVKPTLYTVVIGVMMAALMAIARMNKI